MKIQPGIDARLHDGQHAFKKVPGTMANPPGYADFRLTPLSKSHNYINLSTFVVSKSQCIIASHFQY